MTAKQYTYNFTIPFQDIDAAGIVFFAHIFRYAHESYEIFMAEIGFPLHEYLRQGELILPLKHAEAEYKHPLRYGNRLEMKLTVQKLSNSSFTIAYQCFNEEQVLCAEISTVHVVVKRETGMPVIIPEPLRQALAAYN